MLLAQFIFGLVLIVLALVIMGVVVSTGAWIVLAVMHRLPLVGRRHRHGQWDELNRQGHARDRG